MRKLDKIGVEQVCEMIRNGQPYREIAETAAVSVGALIAWLNADRERSARVREARSLTAAWWDQQAEYEIRTAPETPEGIAKARELAQHFRWRSKMVDPANYGDKVDLHHRGIVGVVHAPYNPALLTQEQREVMRDALLTIDGTAEPEGGE